MEERKENIQFNVAFFLMIILLASNMRAPYTGVGTIISLIQEDLHLSGTLAGMVTTIPLIVFAAVCPLSSGLAGRFGIGRMLAAALVFICVGIVLRAFFGVVGLFGGTVIFSIGSGIMNAIMIGLIKLRFPNHTGIVTSAYTTTMATTSAVAVACSVPLSAYIGWRGDMAIWAILPIVSMIFWFPQAGRPCNRGNMSGGKGGGMKALLRSRKAWLMSIYMGSQSLMFYCVSAWMPSILAAKGMTIERAAAGATVQQIVSLPATLLIPILAAKIKMRKLTTAVNAAYIVGAVMFFYASADSIWIWISIALIAIGLGTQFSACFFLFSEKTHTAEQAAAVSGFAQCSGYVLAAIGPVLMGTLYDLSGAWEMPMIFCFVILLLMCFASFCSSGDDYIL